MRLATSYFGCRIPRHVRSDMRRLRRLGFERVIHTFCENDLFYSSDTLREIVEISKAEGLEVQLDPWGVGGVFGGEAFSEWILEDPDLMQRGPSGRPLAGACLNHPRLRERMREWVAAAARTGADAIFWDEPHWVHPGPRNPDGEPCACSHCLARHGENPAADVLRRSRAAAILDLLTDVVGMASACGLGSSICLLPLGVPLGVEQDWPSVAAIRGVTEFGTDPYWHAFHMEGAAARDAFIDLNANAARAAARGAGIPVMLWLQAFRLPASAERDLLEGTRRLLSHKPETVAIWGFEACAHMSELACENPERVWRGLVRTIRAQRG
jgi:hypothetical protein